jgi:hypothetical protein
VARDELFELAVNRALTYARRLRLDFGSAERLSAGLEVWYLKTRFAYRIPLTEVVATLMTHPGTAGAGWQWRGGPGGGWQEPG